MALDHVKRSGTPVSIPFIAGQWSLPLPAEGGRGFGAMSQSPSLRGSGRFRRARAKEEKEKMTSQSPSLRGSGRFSGSRSAGSRSAPSPSQSPSLRGSGRFPLRSSNMATSATCLNPLHCGAVVASGGAARRRADGADVSIPFIAGQWSLLPRTTPSSLFGVLLRKRRLPCDHIICTRLPF